MSDFASLLGNLQKTADRAKAEATSEGRKSKTAGRKRKLSGDDDDSRSEKRKFPSDVRSLSVQVSFLCIGAQKAGTSWFHEMLRKCPELSLPDQKEVHFWDWHRRRGLGWYSKQFPSRPAAAQTVGTVLVGEVTPCYMTLPKRDIEEIKCLFPSVRIVFLARDLVDRAWSALYMELRHAVRGMEAGQFESSTESALDRRKLLKMEEESNPDMQTDEYFMERLRHSTHEQRNDYAAGLRRWLKIFPKEQLLILNFDDIEAKPKELLKLALGHIGVKSAHAFTESLDEDTLRAKVNATGTTNNAKRIRPLLRKKMQNVLRKPAEEMNELLEELGYSWRLNDYSDSTD